MAAEGCPQTRLPNLVPTPYDADKRSFNAHDPLPETDIGPDTGARPRGFMQERSEPRRTEDAQQFWACRRAERTTLPRARRRHRRDQDRGAPAGPTSQLYPDAVPQ